MGEEEASKGVMAAFLLLAPLLLLGTVAGQAQAEIQECLWLWNVTEGNFSVETTNETYKANTTYVGKQPCLDLTDSQSTEISVPDSAALLAPVLLSDGLKLGEV